MPHHSSLIALWRDERLTDFAVCAEGVEFKAHRVALASSSKYFLKLFESGMRDAVEAAHALQDISRAVLEDAAGKHGHRTKKSRLRSGGWQALRLRWVRRGASHYGGDLPP